MNLLTHPTRSSVPILGSKLFIYLLFQWLVIGSVAGNSDELRTLDKPQTSTSHSFYTSNRDPLLPSAFIKLPIGNIVPKGWVRHQLELESQGMTGHLEELSKWCKFEGN